MVKIALASLTPLTGEVGVFVDKGGVLEGAVVHPGRGHQVGAACLVFDDPSFLQVVEVSAHIPRRCQARLDVGQHNGDASLVCCEPCGHDPDQDALAGAGRGVEDLCPAGGQRQRLAGDMLSVVCSTSKSCCRIWYR